MEDLLDKPKTKRKQKRKPFGKDKFISDSIRWYIYGLFLISFGFKFVYWPGGGLGLGLTGVLAVLLIIWQLIESIARKNFAKGTLDITINLVLIYTIFRLMYWADGLFYLYTVYVVFFVAIVLWFTQSKVVKRKQIIVLFLMLFTFGLSNTPAHEVYYATGLTKTFHSFSHAHAFMGWDRYSWYLYIDGEKEEAIKANTRALEISINEGYDTEIQFKIIEHRDKIVNGSLQWSDFHYYP
ncbi:MAG: hypothetical protein JKY09_02670 [Crocinitomicaceae bacterium]|nr:hypothetical protein [Crocinitomicaceae bacterium]